MSEATSEVTDYGISSLPDRSEDYDKAVASARAVFVERNAQYGDAISEVGVLGACVELVGDVARLKQLVIRSPDHGRAHRDVLIDRFRDIINYGSIALLMLAEDNWEGR